MLLASDPLLVTTLHYTYSLSLYYIVCTHTLHATAVKKAKSRCQKCCECKGKILSLSLLFHKNIKNAIRKTQKGYMQLSRLTIR